TGAGVNVTGSATARFITSNPQVSTVMPPSASAATTSDREKIGRFISDRLRAAPAALRTGRVWNTPLLPGHVLAEELPHQFGDLVAVRFEGEVAGIQQVELQRLQVPLVRLRPLSREDLVVLAPGDEHRRLVLSEVL